jgi:osmotically-inducible protein OsmY
VQGVLNQLVVQMTNRSDGEIRDDVVARLRANDSLERREIVVSVSNGEVAMMGKLQSLAEKRLAEIAAAGVRGVTAVDNQITLRPVPDRSDDAMRDEISGLLANSIYLDDVEIEVEVKERIAYLRGTVSSAAQKDRLQTLAEIWGIAEVNTDAVDIDPDLADGTVRKRKFGDVSDTGIRQALIRAIANDPIVFLAADSISVSVDSGMVALSGTVSRLRCRERAERLAMDIVGVIAVDNELKVEPTTNPPTDEEIIDWTQAALTRSAYLNRREIRVHCHRAHVSLFGLVDSRLEKDLAGWLASGVTGVVHVDNQLAVERKPKSER